MLGACTGAPGGPPGAADAPGAARAPAEDARAPAAIVWGHAQEPLTLNPTTEDGNRFVTTQVALATVLPLWTITPELEYEPTALLDRAEPRTEGGRFSVRYELNPEASWSDGTPITAGDVFFTLETCLDARWSITSRAGCDVVDMPATRAGLTRSSKTVEVVFVEPYAAWRTLFSTADGIILPAHILEGQRWDEAWATDIPIASGPFRFESWEAGEQLTLVRNERYAGTPAQLERLVFAFLADSEAGVRALAEAEIGLLAPPPDPELAQALAAVDGVELRIGAGTIWEHLSFQLARPPLDALHVRQALAMAIDREALVAEVLGPLRPDAAPLGSLVYLRSQAGYEDHIGARVTHDPAGAIALLERNGCVRGLTGRFTCAGEPLSFTLTTTRGDERRARTVELLAEQLDAIGVELTPDLRDAAVVFSDEVLAAGTWDLITFAWVRGPDPGVNVALWSCDGAHNHTGHCDERASRLLAASSREIDPVERARLVDEAGRLLAGDLPALPLYQLPSLLALRTDALSGPQPNASQWGPVWNVAQWQVAGDPPQEG